MFVPLCVLQQQSEWSTHRTFTGPKKKHPIRTPAQEFHRSIKIDPTYYPVLKEDKGFDQFDRRLVAMARSQGVLNVLNPSYCPVTPDEIELFDRHLAFMYNVFASNLLTTKGKELVRVYQNTYDAQSVYDELREYHRDSEKADGDKSTLLKFIMSSQLTADSWFGTHDDYIVHWKEQVRLYNELETVAPLQDHMLFLFLSNAVSLQPHLAAIKGTSDTLQAGTNGAQGPMNFLAYTKLLHSAAQRYDRIHHPKRPKPSSGNRKVYTHETDHGLTQYSNSYYDNYNTPFDIDTSISDINDYQAYRAATGSSSFRGRPYLPNHAWQQLQDESRRLWHQFPLP